MAIAAAAGGIAVIALIIFLIIRHRRNRTRPINRHNDPLELSPSTMQLISDGNEELNTLRRMPPRSSGASPFSSYENITLVHRRAPQVVNFFHESELTNATPSAARYGVGVGASIVGNAGDIGWQQAGYTDHLRPESAYSAPNTVASGPASSDGAWQEAGYSDHVRPEPTYSAAPTYAAPTYDRPFSQTDTDSLGYERPTGNPTYQTTSQINVSDAPGNTYELPPSGLYAVALGGHSETDDAPAAAHPPGTDSEGYEVPTINPAYAQPAAAAGGDFYAQAHSAPRKHLAPAVAPRPPGAPTAPAGTPSRPALSAATTAAVAAALAAVGPAPPAQTPAGAGAGVGVGAGRGQPLQPQPRPAPIPRGAPQVLPRTAAPPAPRPTGPPPTHSYVNAPQGQSAYAAGAAAAGPGTPRYINMPGATGTYASAEVVAANEPRYEYTGEVEAGQATYETAPGEEIYEMATEKHIRTL